LRFSGIWFAITDELFPPVTLLFLALLDCFDKGCSHAVARVLPRVGSGTASICPVRIQYRIVTGGCPNRSAASVTVNNSSSVTRMSGAKCQFLLPIMMLVSFLSSTAAFPLLLDCFFLELPHEYYVKNERKRIDISQ
jgi:hypothetical protein